MSEGFGVSKSVKPSLWILVRLHTAIRRCFLVAVLSFLAREPLCSPRILIEQEDLDLGPVSQNEDVEWSFGFLNAGDEDLIVNCVATSCNCTLSRKGEIRCLPGQTEKMAGKIHVGSGIGKRKYYISLSTNDPLSTTVVLSLAFAIESGLVIAPSRVVFFRVPGKTEERKEVVFSLPGKRLRLAEISVLDCDRFFVEKQPSPQRLDEDSVLVGVKRGTPPGKYVGFLRVSFEGDRRLFSVPLSATVQPVCFVGSSGGKLGCVACGKIVTETLPLLLYASGDMSVDEFRIAVSGVSHPALSAVIAPDNPRLLKVSFCPEKPGLFDGKVTLDLTMPNGEHQEAKVPIVATVDQGI